MLGCWVISNNAVLGVVSIEYGIDDVFTVRLNEGRKLKCTVKAEENGRQYIKAYNTRYYLDECMSL